MKLRKAISYAYPGSPFAKELGCEKHGAYYVQQSILREDGTWSPPYIEQGHDGFSDPVDPDLIQLFQEADGEPCPMFVRHGNRGQLAALGLA